MRRRARSDDLTDLEWQFLTDQPMPVCPESWSLRFADGGPFRAGRPSIEQLWRQNSRRALREWIERQPGTRPSLWWRFNAPEPRNPGETEAAFLAHHGLLAPTERARLRKSDLAPHSAAGRAA